LEGFSHICFGLNAAEKADMLRATATDNLVAVQKVCILRGFCTCFGLNAAEKADMLRAAADNLVAVQKVCILRGFGTYASCYSY
jgi:hypothetical protein